MGFASYLEDINSRLTRIEGIVQDHNKSNGKKIDIEEYFRLRREVLSVIEKVRPYIDRDIDLIENGELRKQNQILEKQSQTLERRNQGLQDGITKLTKEIASLEKTKDQVNRDLAEKDNQLKKMVDESDSLKKRITHGAKERLGLKKSERDLSDLLLDYSSLFETMSKIIKSNAWHKNKEHIRQLESLIETGKRKT